MTAPNHIQTPAAELAASVHASFKALAEKMIAAATAPLLSEIASLRKRLDELPTPKDGADGKDGNDGADGVSVDADAVMRDLTARVEKHLAEIPAPRDGRDGSEGAPGRDAVQIQPHPSIEEDRSYQRGAYATHKGGLWRAERTTDGMDGWVCVVEGIAAVDEVQTSEREITRTVTLSSGAKHVSTFKMRNAIHRGTYRRGAVYELADEVAWDGCTWRATGDGVKDEPRAGANGWQLVAKKGNDGKSAFETAKRAGFEGTEYDFGKALIKQTGGKP